MSNCLVASAAKQVVVHLFLKVCEREAESNIRAVAELNPNESFPFDGQTLITGWGFYLRFFNEFDAAAAPRANKQLPIIICLFLKTP